MSGSYDVIIVGAGHNGLVTAAYLARAGRRVLVLERRDVVGGACVTEELWPGFRVSTAAYVNSLLRPEIIRDLELARHGFELLPRSPSSFTPFPDGRFLLMGPDKELTRQQAAKFSHRDAEALPRYEAMLERVADFIEPTLLQTPPNPWSFRPRNLAQLAGLGWRFLKLGKDGPGALEILTGAAQPILDRWFESEQLKIALATDAIIGAMASPTVPGTAYVLFHHDGRVQRGTRDVGLRARGNGRHHPGARVRGARPWRGDPAEQPGDEDRDAPRAREGRGARGRQRLFGAPGRVEPRRAPDVPPAGRWERAAGGVRRRRTRHRLRERLAQDQRRAVGAARFHRGPRQWPRAQHPPARHDPHRAHARVHGARVRRRQVRPSLRGSDSRVHHPLRRGHDGGAGREARDVVLCAVRPIPAAGRRDVGSAEGPVRGPLLRHPHRVRAQLQARRDRAAGVVAGGSGATVWAHWRQYLPGRDDPVTAVLPAPAARVRRLPLPHQGALSLRLGDAPGRRSHGGVWLQRRPGDPQGPLVGLFRRRRQVAVQAQVDRHLAVVIRPVGHGDQGRHPLRDLAAAEKVDAVPQLGILDLRQHGLAILERILEPGDQLVLGIGARELVGIGRLRAGRRAAEVVVPFLDQVGDHIPERHLGGCGLVAVLVGGHFLGRFDDVLGLALRDGPDPVHHGVLSLRRADQRQREGTDGEQSGTERESHLNLL